MANPIKTENKIKQILKEKFKVELFIPSKELLDEIGIDYNRWKRIVNNKANIRLPEVRAFAKWLDITEDEIVEKKTMDFFETKEAA